MNKKWAEEAINLTPMDVTVFQGKQAFCIPSKRRDYMSENGTLMLPKEVDGGFYIVSNREAAYLSEFRRDVYIPGRIVRNKSDVIVGVRNFTRA